MEISEIQPGETIHCWEPGKKYMAHRFMLYLGKDKNAEDNLLVHSKEHGWDIISLSELPKSGYRSMGRYNIMEVTTDSKKKVNGFVYRFHDKGDSVLISVKLMRGVWKIKQDFKNPSWMIKKEVDVARGAGSKKDC